MNDVVSSAHEMISGMTPELQSGQFVFAILPDMTAAAPLLAQAQCMYREAEGVSLILTKEIASGAGLECDHPMCCITLNVYSSLEGVGLTAAVASALGAQGIACNMVAAYHHDHVFVPAEMAQQALDVLRSLQEDEKTRGSGSAKA